MKKQIKVKHENFGIEYQLLSDVRCLCKLFLLKLLRVVPKRPGPNRPDNLNFLPGACEKSVIKQGDEMGHLDRLSKFARSTAALSNDM